MRTYGITTILAVTAALAFLAGSAGAADDTHWQHAPATPGDWFDPANWSDGVPQDRSLPGVRDQAYIDNGGVAQISGGETGRQDLVWIGSANEGTLELSGGRQTSSLIGLGRLAGAVGYYDMTGGEIQIWGNLSVGSAGQGFFTQTAGTVDVSRTVFVGSQDGGMGRYTLSGTASVETEDFAIGSSGSGEFIQNGGTASASRYLRLGGSGPLGGSYALNDGDLTVQDISYVGHWGRGRFVQEGGTASLGTLILGWKSTASGTVELNGGELTSSHIYVGSDGTGQFTQTGGTCNVEMLSVLADNTYDLTGGVLRITGSAEILGTLDLGSGTPTIDVAGIGSFGRHTHSHCG